MGPAGIGQEQPVILALAKVRLRIRKRPFGLRASLRRLCPRAELVRAPDVRAIYLGRTDLSDLQIHPCFEAMIIGKGHHADGRPTSNTAIGAKNVRIKISHAARYLIGVSEARRAYDEVQRPYEAYNFVEVTDSLLNAGKAVYSSLARGLITVFDTDFRPDPSGMKDGPIGQIGDMSGKSEKIPNAMEGFHLPVLGSVVRFGAEIRQFDAHGRQHLFDFHKALPFMTMSE
jgi:hypothetical protein